MKKNVLITFLLAIIIIFLLFLSNGWHITFSDDNIPTRISYNTEIKNELPKAKLQGSILFKNGFDIPVKEVGQVDSSKIGVYQLTYSAKFLFWNSTISKQIEIIDDVQPIISLKIDGMSETEYGEEYVEEGYTAYDEYDGDITDKVTSVIKDGIVHYTVSDSSGNTTTAERIIKYVDTTAPEISLIGESVVTLDVGQNFVDAGCTAIDKVDGNLTDKINTINNINIKVPGEYEVKYTVADKSGNIAEITRKIIIKAKIEEVKEEPQDSEEKVIYLTFDDGPTKYTQDLLDILEKNDVKATFFVVGRQQLDMITKIHDAGHSIGIHSLTHEYKTIYASVDAYFNDLNKMDEIIYEKAGIHTKLVRFPGGSSNTVSKNYNKGIMTTLAKELTDKGYVYFDWNVSSGDAGEVKTTNEVYKNVINGIKGKKNAIVLQHDSHKFSIDAVQDIITWGKANGYTFKSLNENSPTAHHRINN